MPPRNQDPVQIQHHYCQRDKVQNGAEGNDPRAEILELFDQAQALDQFTGGRDLADEYGNSTDDCSQHKRNRGAAGQSRGKHTCCQQ